MLWYALKMLVLLPLLGGLIWGSLKLTRHMQDKLAGTPQGERRARLVETCFLGPGMRLAVVEFRGREILIGCSRQGLVRLAEADASVTEMVP
jgi:flagellar protein FliO/FliZ